jgi:hypothetical protein
MQTDPDNETEYRRGGKIMKKSPRKFSAGGTPAPSEKPLSGMELEVQNAKRDAQAKKEKEAYEAQRPTSLGPRPPEKPVVKKAKGGKIKKYELGGDVERDTRFDDDTYSRAYNYVNKLRLPPGAAAEKDYEVSGGTKSAPRKFSAPKPTPKPAPKKETSGGSGGSGATEPDVPPQYKRDAPTLGNRGEKRSFNAENALMLASAIPAVRGVRAAKGALDTLRTSRAAKKAGDAVAEANKVGKAAKEAAAARKRAPKDLDEERMAGEGGPNFKRGGVAKYAKGGGVERKGKTAGKIVKMAKGGSVRGYGISKVTNKTKYV